MPVDVIKACQEQLCAFAEPEAGILEYGRNSAGVKEKKRILYFYEQ
ncbi:hypothetical protein [Niabella ginsenosidivorans]|nr:hypothetical protein [Niabella ginsenosidivorans]